MEAALTILLDVKSAKVADVPRVERGFSFVVG
jgi:hypothetical protein